MKINYAELITLATFFESMSDSNQDIPTFIWDLFGKNHSILKEYVQSYNDRLYDKFNEIFVEGQEETPEMNKSYLDFKRKLNSEEFNIELVTISKHEFLANVPSLQGVRGIYLFLKHVTYEQD
jgi:hypothetical protein